jgi:hypothetical protein
MSGISAGAMVKFRPFLNMQMYIAYVSVCNGFSSMSVVQTLHPVALLDGDKDVPSEKKNYAPCKKGRDDLKNCGNDSSIIDLEMIQVRVTQAMVAVRFGKVARRV